MRTKKLMWPRVTFTFAGGSTTMLDSTLWDSVRVWYRCVRKYGRSYLRLKHADVCFSTRADGRTWRWRRVF